MKNKGFTLVELLAVIVILAVISIITIPLIGNVIKDSKKKALEQSVYGLVEAANYFAISNEGRYGFLFNETSKGKTEDGEYSLSYKGEINAKGELYIDSNGDISLCLMNENYYVYKNYNSGIYVGEIKDNNCIIGYDVLTNKYVAMLDDGTGQVSNVYSKEEVNNLINSVNTNVTSNTNKISSLQLDLDNLLNVVNSNTESINELSNDLKNIGGGTITGTYPYTGSWIYDGNSAKPALFVPLPSDYKKYDFTVTQITIQGVGVYNTPTIEERVNGILLYHSSITGTTYVGRLGFAYITFSEKTE